jgi:ribosomal protein L7/L12
MNPSDKGWLHKYIDFRIDFKLEESYKQYLEEIINNVSFEQFIYIINQPTGLLYGFPIKYHSITHPKEEEWQEKDKIKIFLVESMLHAGLFHYQIDVNSNFEKAVCNQLSLDISNFYNACYPSMTKSLLSLFKSSKDTLDITEKIIDKRTNIKTSTHKHLWTRFFHNSLLFLDVIHFSQWLETEEDKRSDFIAHSNENMRLNLLKVIAAAASSSLTINPEEKNIFQVFLHSSFLSEENERIANNYLNNSLTLKDIDFNDFDSWLVKKFVLELAILTIWADQKLEKKELIFIRNLCRAMNLSAEELDASMLSIESYVVENWENVFYLQDKQNFRLIKDNMSKRIHKTLKNNKKKLQQEIYESKELVELLVKSTKTSLNAEEKDKVKKQLIDILKTIPAFAIFMLPAGTILLPLVMKFIPKHILYPSSFHE